MNFLETGREVIVSDLIPTGDIENDKIIIPKILKSALSVHEKNVSVMDMLFGYYHNKTDILAKEKVQQPDINNKISVNYPNIAVTTINAYCFANAPTFSSRGSDKTVQDKVKMFNDALAADNYYGKLLKCTMNSGICGLGYKYCRPATKDEISKGVYFKTSSELDPRYTFIVRANNLDREKILAVNIYERTTYSKDYKTIKKEKVYNVWTKWHQWLFSTAKNGRLTNEKFLIDGKEFDAYPLAYNKIPVVEYERKQDRTSDFEAGLGLINAINNLASTRLDDVQQAVDYLVLMRDIDTESEGALDAAFNALKRGLLSFKSIEGATVQPDVKILTASLNQSEIQTLQDFYCEKLEEVLNIPNRETRSSGGDTGSAVESRNGFRSLENIAGIVTASAFESENEMLDLILSICENVSDCPFAGLKASNIEIKENRNKVENLESATNAYSTMRAAGMNDEDSIRISKLDPDSSSVAQRNSIAQKEEDERQQKLQKQTQVVNGDNKNGISDNKKS